MLTLSIQAGGGSTRMGQDKGTLPFLGEPLIKRIMNRVAFTAEEVIVTTNNPKAYKFLEVPLYSDIIPGVGALSGLYTALVYANHPFVALVACDMPFASASLIAACRDILLERNADAVIPSSDRGLEPMHAVYRKKTCLSLVKDSLNKGDRKMITWHKEGNVHILPTKFVRQFDPHEVLFWNVNTPRDYIEAEAKARFLGN